MTDLEAEIRAALQERGTATVPRRMAPLNRRRRLPRALRMAATIAAVLVIAVPLAVWRVGGTDDGSSHHRGAFVGYHWTIVSAGNLEVQSAARTEDAYVGFKPDGTFVAFDGASTSWRATYEVTNAGFRYVGDYTVGQASNPGPPRADSTFVADLDRVLPGQRREIDAEVDGRTLTLQVGSTVVTATRAGPEPAP